MTDEGVGVIAGVDTHSRMHHAAVIDTVGRELGDREFPATAAGYQALLGWVGSFGSVVAVGVEGTGAYGAGLAAALTTAGIPVVEVDRPDRKARRAAGKSDRLDAYAAARAVASGRATGVPKAHTGAAEAIRVLHATRRSAVKARTQAINQIRGLLITAPAPLRERLTGMSTTALITTLARLRRPTRVSTPTTGTTTALRSLARRYQTLTEEISDLHRQLTALVTATAPTLAARLGIGTDTAAQVLISTGDNPDRLRSDAAFARLAGAAPIPASTGNTHRHRLHRGGDRQLNRALHTITLVRMRHHEPTRAYVKRRTTQGLSKKDIIRCLKRYIAREIHHVLTTPNPTPETTQNTQPTAP